MRNYLAAMTMTVANGLILIVAQQIVSFEFAVIVGIATAPWTTYNIFDIFK